MYLFDQRVSGSSDDSTRASSVDMIQSILQAPIIPDIPGDSHWERSISPLISDELVENRFSDPPASRRKSPYPARSRNRSGSLSTEDTILLILPSLKPAHESSIFTEAKFVGGNLLTMLENHAAMSKLLDVFGLDTSDPARISIFHDQSNEAHKLSARAVLKACGWSESTFTNKGSRYRNAEKAAKMQWKGEEPEIGSDSRKDFEAWKGAVYMWSALGPLATGMPPCANSQNEAERFACELLQKSLDTISTAAFRTAHLLPSSA
ncbi:hypothetical protein DFH09DRAFT_1102297 [Mycena vulgaris]|nr:hypothetical protein DFH09DRAFT_1102297 [Mycena vulgaris]